MPSLSRHLIGHLSRHLSHLARLSRHLSHLASSLSRHLSSHLSRHISSLSHLARHWSSRLSHLASSLSGHLSSHMSHLASHLSYLASSLSRHITSLSHSSYVSHTACHITLTILIFSSSLIGSCASNFRLCFRFYCLIKTKRSAIMNWNSWNNWNRGSSHLRSNHWLSSHLLHVRLWWLHSWGEGSSRPGIVVSIPLGGEAKLLAQGRARHRVGEAVELTEVLVFQRHVSIVDTDC